tara:strand:- start:330 stop:443 length:114 start_codon:yes stop_codon:yes gene_type:complete
MQPSSFLHDEENNTIDDRNKSVANFVFILKFNKKYLN